jgi:hypothetical protein
MSQQQYNEQSSFLYQSSGTINNFNNFNQHIQAHQEDSGDTKVMIHDTRIHPLFELRHYFQHLFGFKFKC